MPNSQVLYFWDLSLTMYFFKILVEVFNLNHLGEFSKFAGGSSANHGSVILAQVPELTS